MKQLVRNACLLTGLFFYLSYSFSQTSLSYYLPPDVTYDKDIPTPKEFLGYEVGEWHVGHDQLSYYMRMLASISDRMGIEEMGQTHEGRKTFVLRITAEKNQKRIEQIQAEHVQLTDPERSADLNIKQMPAVVWLGYTVHGNEASGSNAALLTAYYLAAGQGKAVNDILDQTIILLDPCMNPDGMNRFASWVNTHKSHTQVSDNNHREFHEAWPGGRTNHYWFDLNRDWLPAQQPESQARLAKFHEWKPNLLTDHHEMGTSRTFFFQPGIPTRNHPLTPAKNYELTYELAKFHAKGLDKIGSLYYTQESYDDFYYGKGSTYPDVNGAVGILFEQASSRGHAQETPHGVMTFPFTIRNQFTVSLTSLNGLVALKDEFLEHQRTFYQHAMEEARKSETKAWVVGSKKDPVRAAAFVEMLLRHQIHVYEIAEDKVEIDGISFERGSNYLIPTTQPQFRLIQSMFERRTTFQDSLFYDVSAWTLPLAFNLPHKPIGGKVFSKSMLGREIKEIAFPKGKLLGEQTNYAYALEWQGYLAPKALYHLLDKGLVCKVATRSFEMEGHYFDYGTIIVPVARQPLNEESIFDLLEGLAEETGTTIHALSTGLTPNGIDLGSPSLEPLQVPKVALLAGQGTRSYDVGEVWHLLDQRYEMPVTILPCKDLGRTDLGQYNTLVMADGSYGSLNGGEVEKLQNWLSEGGTLVAERGAVRWLSNQGIGGFSFKSREQDADRSFPYEARSRRRGAHVIGGAIFEAKLDLTHPIAYGYDDELVPVFRNSTHFLAAEGKSMNYPLIYTEAPLLAGYISPANKEVLPGTASVGVKRYGRGHIIAFVDNPNFRAFWYGTNKLFANALFFGHFIDG